MSGGGNFCAGSDILWIGGGDGHGFVRRSVGVLGQRTVALGYLVKPYPQFLSLDASQLNAGVSSYNALQATFQKRFSGGGTIVGNYT